MDLVSYTSLVRNLDAAALSQLINHFEQSCLDVIAPLGGRIIKTLGDEVFFLTETPDAIAEISLQLSEKIGADPQLPDSRVAFIWGEVLATAVMCTAPARTWLLAWFPWLNRVLC